MILYIALCMLFTAGAITFGGGDTYTEQNKTASCTVSWINCSFGLTRINPFCHCRSCALWAIALYPVLPI